jgi:hypothetical protein
MGQMEPNKERWATLPFIEQMANIGSEVGRTAKWIAKDKAEMAASAYLRALDLFDLTIEYGRIKERGRSVMLNEVCRARDYFTDAYSKSDIEKLAYLDKYFSFFALRWQSEKSCKRASY